MTTDERNFLMQFTWKFKPQLKNMLSSVTTLEFTAASDFQPELSIKTQGDYR
jgi:hypothetical protein